MLTNAPRLLFFEDLSKEIQYGRETFGSPVTVFSYSRYLILGAKQNTFVYLKIYFKLLDNADIWLG